jgi:hypothetical protein
MIHRSRVRSRDEITEMFLRRMATIHKRAKDELHQIHLEQRERTERLVEALDSLLTVLSSQEDDHAAAAKMRTLVGEKAEIEALRAIVPRSGPGATTITFLFSGGTIAATARCS